MISEPNGILDSLRRIVVGQMASVDAVRIDPDLENPVEFDFDGAMRNDVLRAFVMELLERTVREEGVRIENGRVVCVMWELPDFLDELVKMKAITDETRSSLQERLSS